MAKAELQLTELGRRRQHRRKRARTVALGGVVILFAVFGVGVFIYFVVGAGITSIRNYLSPKETDVFFETYLNYVVGLDPDTVGSPDEMNPDWKLKVALWETASKGKENGTYGFMDNGLEVVPVSDILTTYRKYFGGSSVPNYETFIDSGITYKYDSAQGYFYIPYSAINYIFTSNVTNIVRESDTVTLTVEYLASSGWTQKSDGTMVPPQASKTMIYVLKGGNGNYSVYAIKSISSASSTASSIS